MSNKLEIEQLIEIVRGHRCLYDPGCPEYKDAQLNYNTWESIAGVMGLENVTGADWKKKWRNQRDMYIKKRKEVRTNKSGQAAKRARKWTFFDQMCFLDKYTEDSRTDTNVPDDTVQSKSDEEDEEDSSVGRSDDELSLPSRSVVSETTLPTPPVDATHTASTVTNAKNRGKKRRAGKDTDTFSMEKAITEMIVEHRKSREQILQDALSKKTSEELFFASCAERLSMLPENLKSYVMFQISTLLFNAENTERQAVEITPLPASFSQTASVVPHLHAPSQWYPDPRPSEVGVVYGTNASSIIATAMNIAENIQ